MRVSFPCFGIGYQVTLSDMVTNSGLFSRKMHFFEINCGKDIAIFVDKLNEFMF